MDELDELFERLLDLQERQGTYFDYTDDFHEGDRGYQDILEEIDDVNERIDEILNEQIPNYPRGKKHE